MSSSTYAVASKTISCIIIGVQKAGTTALLRLIEQHPFITSHHPDEFSYFINDEMYGRNYNNAFKHHYGTLEKNDNHIVAKNVGIMESEKAIQRLYKHNPNVKIIVVLRNPVDRAYSAFWYMKSIGAEQANNFGDIIFKNSTDRFPNEEFMQRSCDYLGKGMYFNNLQVVEKYFRREQILILSFDDLKNDPNKVSNQIFSFMDLKYYEVNTSTDRNVSRQIKYKWLANIFNGRNQNKVKKTISHFLSPELKFTIKQKVKQLNKSDKAIPPLDTDLKEKLIKYFDKQNQLLAQKYNIKF